MKKRNNFDDWYHTVYIKGEYFQRLKAVQLDDEPYCQLCGKHKASDVIHLYTHNHKGQLICGFEHLSENRKSIASACKNCVMRYGKYPIMYKESLLERVYKWIVSD